jgi:hypothetical protein
MDLADNGVPYACPTEAFCGHVKGVEHGIVRVMRTGSNFTTSALSSAVIGAAALMRTLIRLRSNARATGCYEGVQRGGGGGAGPTVD